MRKINKSIKSRSIAFLLRPSRVLLLSIILFLLTSVYFTIQISTSGAKLASLEKKEAKLIQENQLLTDGIVKANSLFEVSNKAETLGFIKPNQIYYLSSQEVVAKLP